MGVSACHCCGLVILSGVCGHQPLYRDCLLKRLIFPIVCAESPASESCASPPSAAPCLPPLAAEGPPWHGVWAATIDSLGMRSLEWSGPLMHANCLGHRVPA